MLQLSEEMEMLVLLIPWSKVNCNKSWCSFCIWLDLALIYIRKESHAVGHCREPVACDLLVVPNLLGVLFLKTLCSVFFLPPPAAPSSTKCCLPRRTFKLIFQKCWWSRTHFYCCHNISQACFLDCVCKTLSLISSNCKERMVQTIAPKWQPICLCVLQAKMTSLQGSIKLRAEAGRKFHPYYIYCYALAPFDPMVCAKVIGTQVLFLLLGELFIMQHASWKRGKHVPCMSAYLHTGVGQSWMAAS